LSQLSVSFKHANRCDAEHPGPAEAKAFGAIADLGREVFDALA